MAIDLAKTAALCGLVVLAAWMTFLATTQRKPVADKSNALSTATQEPGSDNKLLATVANADKTENSTGITTVPTSDSVTTSKDITETLAQDLANQDNIYESSWILQLPDDNFIVQFGSSLDRSRLYEDAKAFPVDQVAFYPFKLANNERIIYGFSAGVYSSLDEATLAIKQMPQSQVANAPWIRPVAELKKQIKAAINN